MEESDDQAGFAASWKVRRNDEGEAPQMDFLRSH